MTTSRTDRAIAAPLARRFEAIVFDWDGIAVPGGQADAPRMRRLVEEACGVGIELAIVSGAAVEHVDGRLKARPGGPGGLVLALNRGLEVFRVDRDGPRLVQRRTATFAEQAALSRAAELTVERLAARGFKALIVPEQLNRRKIELIPDPEGVDPPRARTDELPTAMQPRLSAAGIAALSAVVEIARDAAADAGLADPRVTSDAKHVEIGLTDKSGSTGWIMRELWRSGIGPGQVLVAGDELEPLGRFPGSDSNLLVDEALSVGLQAGLFAAGVVRLGGGPEMFAGVLEDQIARRRNGELPLVNADPAWTLPIDDSEPRLARVHGSLLTLADGRLGTRGSMLVSDPVEDPSVLHSGVYAGQGPETQLLAGPRWNTIELADRAELPTRRVLDLRTGTLSHEHFAGDARLQALLLSSLARPATTVMRVLGRGTALPARRGLRPPPDVEHEGGARDCCSWMRVAGSPGSVVAASYERVRDHHGEGGDWVLDRLSSYEGASAGLADERPALARVDAARELGFDAMLSEHRRAWAARWENADIHIDGDPELQLGVRLALFHLIASVADDGEAAVGARGLTGGGYRGHVFWDSDVHVLPFLAATHPRAARAMLEYRVRRLPAALRAARGQGRAGARFPWESAASGEDVTPVSVQNRRGEIDPVYTGMQQEHIVADVAWAAAHYIDWTGDQAFADGPGLELLLQTARWWASRIELNTDGTGHIRGVMGPDEYHPLVDDNAYTNVMARWNLRRAAHVHGDVIDQTERHHWLELADAIVDGYDPSTGIYEQFEGFHKLEPLLIPDLAPRPVAADMLLGHERTQTAQVIKQADVLMLHYLVPDEVAVGSLEHNIKHYDPRTAHGSTLSPGVHAALLARAGQHQPALELLRLTARIDIDNIGDTTREGVHLAAMGSVWRALAYGYAGLRPAGDALTIDPTLAPGWETLDLRVQFRGSRVHVRIDPKAVEVSADPPISALSPAGEHVILTRATQTFELSPQTPTRAP
jgi:trehalose/maltose hydrolase-like predicted phosphorylase